MHPRPTRVVSLGYQQTAICGVTTNPHYPQFEGGVGQLGRSRAFREFICRSVGQNVRLDISIPESEFSGNCRRGQLWLALYHDVSWLPDPCGTTMSGVEITLSRRTEGTGATFDCVDGQVRLCGSFAVLQAKLLEPGFISVELEPLTGDLGTPTASLRESRGE